MLLKNTPISLLSCKEKDLFGDSNHFIIRNFDTKLTYIVQLRHNERRQNQCQKCFLLPLLPRSEKKNFPHRVNPFSKKENGVYLGLNDDKWGVTTYFSYENGRIITKWIHSAQPLDPSSLLSGLPVKQTVFLLAPSQVIYPEYSIFLTS